MPLDPQVAGPRGGAVQVVSEDEHPGRFDESRMGSLRPAFRPDGTITAANASPLSDGAAAVLLATADRARDLGLKPIARVVSYADAAQASTLHEPALAEKICFDTAPAAAQEPIDFTTAPTAAVRKALDRAGLTTADIDWWELNEAFAVVGLANTRLLGLDPARVNAFGGAVALGHPLGCSGARIVCTLLNVMRVKGAAGRYGCAAVCNGGGGASAIIIEYLGQ